VNLVANGGELTNIAEEIDPAAMFDRCVNPNHLEFGTKWAVNLAQTIAGHLGLEVDIDRKILKKHPKPPPCIAFKRKSEFRKKIGLIDCYDHLSFLGLEPMTILGNFSKCQVSKLRALCKRDSNYHVVTRLDHDQIVNRFIEGEHRYYLAEGDADPNLEFQYTEEMKKEVNEGMSKVTGVMNQFLVNKKKNKK
jgi:hypothetical protein